MGEPEEAGVPTGTDRDLTAEARIRRAALRLFAERGFDGTTTREIAQGAGVSPGLVIHHFGTKQRLRDHVDRDVMATVDLLFASMADPAAGADLSVWQQGFRKLFQDHPHVAAYLRRGIVEGTSAGGLVDRMLEYAARHLRNLIDAGGAREPNDFEATVAVVSSMALTQVLFADRLVGYLGMGSIEDRLAAAQLDVLVHGLWHASDDSEEA